MALVALVAVVSGCLTAPTPTSGGRPIDTEFVRSIERGETTAETVRTNLGEPQAVSESVDSQTWTYSFWEVKTTSMFMLPTSRITQTLMITFRDGKVLDYSLTQTGGTQAPAPTSAIRSLR